MADKWTSRQTKYTVGGGLGGLLAGILLRRFIDGDKKTALKDYLLWGGLGTALGAGGGYLAGTDRELSASDKEYLKAQVSEAEKKLEEAKQTVADIERRKGYNSYWGMNTGLGSFAQGGVASAAALTSASLLSAVPAKGKVGATLSWLPTLGKGVLKHAPATALLPSTVLYGSRKLTELTDADYQRALENVDKLQRVMTRDKRALELFGEDGHK